MDGDEINKRLPAGGLPFILFTFAASFLEIFIRNLASLCWLDLFYVSMPFWHRRRSWSQERHHIAVNIIIIIIIIIIIVIIIIIRRGQTSFSRLIALSVRLAVLLTLL